MLTNDIREFFKNEDNVWWYALYRLITSTENETRQQLLELENELREQNRFFPKGKIIEGIDSISGSVCRRVEAGTLIYRCRTIDKYHENDYSKELDAEIETYFKSIYPAFSIENFEDSFMEMLVSISVEGRDFDYRGLESRLARFKQRGWWGYDEKESDAPPHQAAKAGRINPAGISYLYAADNMKTAALEVRPVRSQIISVVEIEITEDIKLFDLAINHKTEKREVPISKINWNALGEYFSQPNYSGDEAYLATQYISEYIKSKKDTEGKLLFDGICFESSLNPDGLNYVLFDTSKKRKYKLNCSSLYRVVDIEGNLNQILPLTDDSLRAFMGL